MLKSTLTAALNNASIQYTFTSITVTETRVKHAITNDDMLHYYVT